ncbi:MAG: DUF721 domain-containing protein [Bradyrhizobium sp.]|nr:MAG: DUF721 domain-containing protein [Bradyrhizobium sp.]
MARDVSGGGAPKKPPGDKSRSRPAQVGSLLKGIVEPTLAARGLGQMSLIADWPAIVGADVARYAQPVQIQWPPRGDKQNPAEAAPATLVLRIDPAFALEAQHAAPIVVARVNAHLGWRCIGRIAFRQGPLAQLQKPRRVTPAPSDAARQRAATLAEPIADDELRGALTRLGARAIDRDKRRARREEP